MFDILRNIMSFLNSLSFATDLDGGYMRTKISNKKAITADKIPTIKATAWASFLVYRLRSSASLFDYYLLLYSIGMNVRVVRSSLTEMTCGAKL